MMGPKGRNPASARLFGKKTTHKMKITNPFGIYFPRENPNDFSIRDFYRRVTASSNVLLKSHKGDTEQTIASKIELALSDMPTDTANKYREELGNILRLRKRHGKINK